jgi:hypothetical protein
VLFERVQRRRNSWIGDLQVKANEGVFILADDIDVSVRREGLLETGHNCFQSQDTYLNTKISASHENPNLEEYVLELRIVF